MKSRFLTLLLILTFTLITVVMGWGYGISTITHDWTTPENEQSAADPLFGSAYKYAAKGHSASPSTNTSTYWVSSYGSVSLEVTAELLSIGDEMNVTGWAEATSAQDLVSAPSKDGVRTNKIKHDSEGRHYFYDAKHATDTTGNASAMTAYKRHPVAAYSSNKINPRILLPWNERLERNFSHSAGAYAYFSDENTPSELPDLNPYATGSLDVSSRSSLNLGIDYVEFTTPHCYDDQAHEPGPCPDP